MTALQPLDACSRLVEILGDRVDLTPEQMASQLTDWEFFDVRGAVVLRRGPEIHAAAPSAVRGRWINRAGIRRLLRETIERFGAVVTTVMSDNPEGHAFVKRFGFEAVGDVEKSTCYVLRECRHA